ADSTDDSTAMPPLPKQLTDMAAAKTTERPASTRAPAAEPTPEKNPAAAKTYEARGKVDDRDDLGAAVSALAKAERLYADGRYAAALPLYEQAYEPDVMAVQKVRDHYGYCLLFHGYQRYNAMIESAAAPPTAAEWTALEADLILARRLSPALTAHADKALTAVAEFLRTAGSLPTAAAKSRSGRDEPSVAIPVAGVLPADDQFEKPIHLTEPSGSSAAATTALSRSPDPTPLPTVSVQHLPPQGPWQICATENFRIYHRDAAMAAAVAKTAEEARRYGHEKWFGAEPLPRWEPICELYLYPTAADYSQSTGESPESPGHTKVVNDGGRILSRLVALRVDAVDFQNAVLPHEINHVVMAGRFGRNPLPRWADEGMAVLTEPRVKQEGHLTNLGRLAGTPRRFTCAQLMTMAQYPGGGQMRDFYAHGVGLCRYLVERGGSQKLPQFIRRSFELANYEIALQEVYGMSNFAELERDFDQYVGSLAGAGSPVVASQR
ncbi:MAG: hypothetical protein ACRDD1_21765, partial [Planctomycetia bacterium]